LWLEVPKKYLSKIKSASIKVAKNGPLVGIYLVIQRVEIKEEKLYLIFLSTEKPISA